MAVSDKVVFREIIDSYQVIFFDAYGVLNDAGGILPGVAETLRYLNQIGKHFLIVSNDSSNSPRAIADKYLVENESLVKESQIVCSGMIAEDYLAARHSNGHFVYFGEEKSTGYLSAAKKITPIMKVDNEEPCDAFVLLGCGGADWRTGLDRCVNYLRTQSNCDLIAPNPDLIFYAGQKRVGLAAGSLAHMLETVLKRDFKYFGKPYQDIFRFAFNLARKDNPELTTEQVLMVGDNLDTDILGAKRAGLHSFLVKSGNTSDRDTDFDNLNVVPTYIGESIQ